MPKYRKRTDANQKEIVRLLNMIPGCKAYVLHDPVDLLVGYKGTNWLIEIKRPEKIYQSSGYTKKQKEWMPTWPGQVQACATFEQVYELITGN